MTLKLKELIYLVEVKLNYAIMQMILLVVWQTFILLKNLNVVDEFGKASEPKLNKYMQVLKILIMRTGSHVAITLISKFKMP